MRRYGQLEAAALRPLRNTRLHPGIDGVIKMGRYAGRPVWLTEELIPYNLWLESQVIEHFELGNLEGVLLSDMFGQGLVYSENWEGEDETFSARFTGIFAYHTVHLDDIRPMPLESGHIVPTFLYFVSDEKRFPLAEILDRLQMSCIRSIIDFLTFVDFGREMIGGGLERWIFVPPLIPPIPFIEVPISPPRKKTWVTRTGGPDLG